MHCCGKRLLGRRNRRGKHLPQIRALGGSLLRTGGRNTGNGQNGPLRGLADGLICSLYTCRQRIGKGGGGAFLHPLEAFGKAPEQQRQNYAGIPASAAHGGRSGQIGDFGQRGLAGVSQSVRSGAQGQAHVGTRVAVRHGENIQFVDLLLMLLNQSGSAQDHFAKQRSVEGISQGGHLPFSRASWSLRTR